MDDVFNSMYSGGIMFPEEEDDDVGHFNGDGWDIFIDKDNVYISLELKGVERDSIVIKGTETRLLIGANIENGYYERPIPLPIPCESKGIKHTFINNVLDITIKRKNDDTLSKEDRELIEKRLRDLGYMR
jgi:hypothetical protein